MKPFLITTTEFRNGKPKFITRGLSIGQMAFVKGCLKSFEKKPKADYNFAMISWVSKEDFCATISEVKDPELAELEYTAMFEDFMGV